MATTYLTRYHEEIEGVKSGDVSLSCLSYREREVVKLIVQGYTRKQITAIFKVTKACVAQVELNAWDKLRRQQRRLKRTAEMKNMSKEELLQCSFLDLDFSKKNETNTRRVLRFNLARKKTGDPRSEATVTIGDLTECNADELLAFEGFGKAALLQVRNKLAKYGLELKGEI